MKQTEYDLNWNSGEMASLKYCGIPGGLGML